MENINLKNNNDNRENNKHNKIIYLDVSLFQCLVSYVRNLFSTTAM